MWTEIQTNFFLFTERFQKGQLLCFSRTKKIASYLVTRQEMFTGWELWRKIWTWEPQTLYFECQTRCLDNDGIPLCSLPCSYQISEDNGLSNESLLLGHVSIILDMVSHRFQDQDFRPYAFYDNYFYHLSLGDIKGWQIHYHCWSRWKNTCQLSSKLL